ncbi:DUF4940 domain-containing protein [Thermotoga sp. KOL6]|uniref:DUF4940 domain-containing protein n=1 Tax=Thermotoga sp. KOL6 TaxID=126741 RepID=UPI000C78B379|nr:DUF4940 domain-containing protein [Thermotoga sp. KOL6]PLV59432.1 hypothetical protein AS005_06750 [Thermotoga sp. KOL6]
MLRLPNNVTLSDGDKIIWNGLNLPEIFVLETSRMVLESSVPIKGEVVCFPVKTILGPIAVFTESRIEPYDILADLLNYELQKIRWYNEEVEKLVDVLSESWRVGKRIFIMRSRNLENRLSLRMMFSNLVDAVYNAGDFDVGIAPSGISLPRIGEDGKVVFSDPEEDLHEAVRKALMMNKYLDHGVAVYEDLNNYDFSLHIDIPEVVKIFLRSKSLFEVAKHMKLEEEEAFKKILEFEKETLISPRIPIEAFLLLKEG